MEKFNFQRIMKIGAVLVLSIMLLMMLTSVMDWLINPNDRPRKERLDLDSFSLDTLTDDQILSIDSQYTAYKYKSTKNGSGTGVNASKYEEYDRDELSFSSKKITGIHPVLATKVKDATLRVNVESVLNSGEMKIVVIKDGAILEYIEVGKTQQLTYYAEGEHTYYFKILCNKANISVTVSREIQFE